MSVKFEEILFARPGGDGDLVYHIVLAEYGTAFDGSPTLTRHGPFNAAQAAALGYPIDTVLSEIDVAALQSLEAARADLAAMQDQLSALSGELTRAQAQVATLEASCADHGEAYARLGSQAARMEIERDAARAEAAALADELAARKARRRRAKGTGDA